MGGRRNPCRKGASCTCTCGGWLPACFFMSGLGNMGAMEGYFPVFRFSGPARHASQVQEGPGGVEEGMGGHSGISRSEGGGTPHFRTPCRSMGTKKYKDAFECFQQAAELGSPRGYWGMAFLYDLGKYGVKRDKKKADELNRKAAAAAYAPSAMQIRRLPGRTRRGLVGLSPAEAKEQAQPPQEGCRRRLCLRTVQHGHHVPERLRRTARTRPRPGNGSRRRRTRMTCRRKACLKKLK